MTPKKLPSPLLAVTDRHGHPRPLPETVQAILDGGGRWIWFRDKDMAPDARLRLGEAVAGRVRAAGGFLTVGGDVGLALALGADGVHLSGGAAACAVAEARARLGPAALIGVSAHGLREVEAAAEAGADYVTLSPIFGSASKPGYGPALGPEGITAALCIGLPIVALGGIVAANAAGCRMAGAASIAVMGALMRSRNPIVAMQSILNN